jgi:hypothetical protein
MHYFEDSFRYYPSNFDNLIVLGFLYFKDEIYEKAIHFFELAAKVQPNAVIFYNFSILLRSNTLNAFINLETIKKPLKPLRKFILNIQIIEKL